MLSENKPRGTDFHVVQKCFQRKARWNQANLILLSGLA